MEMARVCGHKPLRFNALSQSRHNHNSRGLVVSMVIKRSPKRLKYTDTKTRFNKEGGLVYIEADPSGSDSWRLEPVVNLLKQGAVGVIPTDTLYAIACDLTNHSAIERLRRIKNIDASKYTFILMASKALPKQCIRFGTTSAKYASRKNVGVRMPDDAICQAILKEMSAPLICTSIKFLNEDEWMIDPVMIADTYGPEGLDFVVDGGVRLAQSSTVVDMTKLPPRVLREGKGTVTDWMVLEDDQETDVEEDLIPAAI
ncbi:uncharacterized protein LOC131609110 isoform X2 [Vicia villosa]|uniref:uncharacterized protein LOC131609110 isoform X2 n=1 Tax=Vicia villosa TaxID=3911 RepID=UPI00273C2075|nr:uncharacterized protein LOC131609110 isoform X2 [Vicia villosa]